MRCRLVLMGLGLVTILTPDVSCSASTVSILVEAEQFDSLGGWGLNQQFMDQMGSPFVLAHGLGIPVAEATTTATFPESGIYRVWVRTRDWVAPWAVPGAPGRFQVSVAGQKLRTTFNAARRGVKVAMIQDRPIWGGNDSSEVRVWLGGDTNFEPYPRIGDLVAELEPARRAHYGPENTAELYEDQRRIELVRAEKWTWKTSRPR